MRSHRPRLAATTVAASTVLAAVAGIDDGAAVLRVSDSTHADTFVVDLASGRTRWKRPQFNTQAVSGGVAVGWAGGGLLTESRSLTGLAAADGSVRWAGSKDGFTPDRIQSGGPTLLVVTGIVTGPTSPSCGSSTAQPAAFATAAKPPSVAPTAATTAHRRPCAH